MAGCRHFSSWLWLPPLLLSVGLFAPCIFYSEWYIDELFAVLRNEDARGETPLKQVFTNDFWGNSLLGGWTHKSYRPLTVLSFAWQFKLLSLIEEGLFRPQPLRAFNIALHAGNTLLLYALLRQLKLDNFWSMTAASLFASHPVHVENIVYLVGRADCLATTGWLLAALLHLRLQKPDRVRCCSSLLLLGLSAALAILAGLCKESGITLLVFLAGIELCTPKAMLRRSLYAATILLTFAVLAVVRFRITSGTSASFGYVDTPVQYNENIWARTWSYLYQHAYYGKLLLLPGHLSWDYSFDALPTLRASWLDVRALAVCTAYLALFALISRTLSRSRGSRRALLGLQMVIIPFVPASNLFFTVGVTVGERLLYPSTTGAALVMASLGQALSRGSRLCKLAALALLGAYIHGCWVRVGDWRSSEALYEADAKAWPRSVKTQHQVATVYHAQNRLDEALYHYNASLAILDDNALTDQCMAQIYIEQGKLDLALQRYEKIMKGHGVGFSQFNLYMLYVDYGFTLASLKRFEEAIPALQTGLNKNLAVPHGLNAIGYCYANLNMLQEAQEWFAKGLEYDPENGLIWSNMAVVWMAAGAIEQAAQGLDKALELEPDNAIAAHNAYLLQAALQNGGAFPSQPRLELFFTRGA